MKGLIEAIEKENLKESVPAFNVGDTVKVSVKVVEGTRERLQAFEGVVIAKKNGGHPRDVHRPQAVLRRRGGAHVPRAFSQDRRHHRYPQGQGTQGKTVLSARQNGQGGKDQRSPLNRQKGSKSPAFLWEGGAFSCRAPQEQGAGCAHKLHERTKFCKFSARLFFDCDTRDFAL